MWKQEDCLRIFSPSVDPSNELPFKKSTTYSSFVFLNNT